MASSDKLLVTLEDGVKRITFNRPERRNSVDVETVELLHEAITRSADDESKVVIITGAGDAFCAGADLQATSERDIKSIDVTDASKAPGVVGVYTARDFKGQLAGTHPAAPAFVAEKKFVPERFPIAEKEVRYQGEIVAVVLAETKAQAADAANMIQVDYDELPAVMDLEKALAKGSPKAHEDGPDNVCWDFTYTPLDLTEADISALFAPLDYTPDRRAA